MQVNKAVFLDKDGTIIKDVPYNVDPLKIKPERGVLEGLRLLVEHGYDLFIVTNQSGIAKGYFDMEDIFNVRDFLQDLLRAHGLPPFKAFYFCPHHPDGLIARFSLVCNCRKPAPGLLQAAEADYGVCLKQSWMVGDILNDIEAGNRAGCKSILINNGNETLWEGGAFRNPTFIVADFLEAASTIVSYDARHISLES